MSTTPAALLARDHANDSLGTPFSNVSPYLIDFFTLAVLFALYRYGVGGGSVKILAIGYSVVATLAVWGALRSLAICRFITDTPKSKVQSAAQGFVELQGQCDFFGNRECQGFMSGPPCVWHRYSIVRLTGWPLQIGASRIPFVLSDGTGSCVINPVGAKVISSSTRTWTENGKRFSSRYIHPGATMYVLGELRTRSTENHSRKRTEVSKLLAIWKKDRRWLNDEFDANSDGVIDSHEWEAVRGRAEVVTERLMEANASDPVNHMIGKPKNGMPFIISDRDPTPLAKTFMGLSIINVLVAVGAFVYACLLLGGA